MAQKGNLLSVRQDIRVVDATIRDGGLCNDFRFSDNFVRDLYKANLKAGVDYMEFGYKASKEIFDEDDFGKWKFCNDDDIRAIIGEGSPKMKVAVMADVGRTDFETDIIPKNESPIDLVRIATYMREQRTSRQPSKSSVRLPFRASISSTATALSIPRKPEG